MITVLTLFCGRWHSFEAWYHGLTHLDWPKEDIQLLWYSNAPKMFNDHLARRLADLKKMGMKGKLVVDNTITSAPMAFKEGEDHSALHTNTIAALYNAAWQHLETDDVLLLEDDCVAPSYTLKRFTETMEQKKKCAKITACTNDRHSMGTVGVWETNEFAEPKGDGKLHKFKTIVQPRSPYGIQKVSAGGFCCSLIRKSRLPRVMDRQYPFICFVQWPGWKLIHGCDVVFGLEITKNRREVYADFEVRPLHLDSQSKIH